MSPTTTLLIYAFCMHNVLNTQESRQSSEKYTKLGNWREAKQPLIFMKMKGKLLPWAAGQAGAGLNKPLHDFKAYLIINAFSRQ